MSVIVRDDGFHAEVESHDVFVIDPADYDPKVDFSGIEKISVIFANFSDGRGFGIARDLRDRGYQGILQASGYLISDQYTMARRVGFDEVKISDELALRQDESQWLARSNWKSFDYQSRLGQEVGAEIEYRVKYAGSQSGA